LITPILEWCISKRCSLARLQLACLIWGVCVSGCGSSGGGQQPGLGVGDHAGGASGQNAGGAGTGGTRTTGMSGGSGSSGAGAGAGANGSAGAGRIGVGGAGGGKGSGVQFAYCPGEEPRAGYDPCATDADCSVNRPICRDAPYSGGSPCQVEVCLVCAGNGVGGHAWSVSLAGSGGSITMGAAGNATGAAGTSGGGGVGCGDRTCGPNQYCRAACGVASPSAGAGGRPTPGTPTCRDLPAACSGVPTCSCICGPASSFCTPGAAEVQCGCG